jgi:hypothetical protein
VLFNNLHFCLWVQDPFEIVFVDSFRTQVLHIRKWQSKSHVGRLGTWIQTHVLRKAHHEESYPVGYDAM